MCLIGDTMKLRSIIASRFALFLFVIFFTITGCTSTRTPITVRMYSGTQLSPDKIAKIKGTHNFYLLIAVTAHILKVDGQEVLGEVDGQKVLGEEIEIIPGNHEVIVFLRAIAANTYAPGTPSEYLGEPQTFSFIAKAGHVYKVDGNWNHRDNQIWIFDEQTREIVAGKKP